MAQTCGNQTLPTLSSRGLFRLETTMFLIICFAMRKSKQVLDGLFLYSVSPDTLVFMLFSYFNSCFSYAECICPCQCSDFPFSLQNLVFSELGRVALGKFLEISRHFLVVFFFLHSTKMPILQRVHKDFRTDDATVRM